MAFDPDAYLAEGGGVEETPSFDPDAYLGIQQPTGPEPERRAGGGITGDAADIGVSFMKGLGTGTRMISDVFGANNPVSQAIAGYEDYMDSLLSAESKQDSQEISRILKDAEGKGILPQIMAGLEAFTVAPAEMTASTLGMMLPNLAGGVYAKAAQLTKAGVIGLQMGIGAAQGAGSVKGQIYTAVQEELRQQGLPEDQIDKVATEAQAYNGRNLDQILLGAGLGAAASSTGAEKIMTRLITGVGKEATEDIVKAAIKGGLSEAPIEALQGGQEKVAENVALQRIGVDVPTMQGVIPAATMEATAGLLIGGGAGAVEAIVSPEDREERDINKKADQAANEFLAPNDPTSQAVVKELTRRENAVKNLQEAYDVLEPTSQEAQKLKLELGDAQRKLSAYKEIANKAGLSLPITTAEQQQIELAKQIAAPPTQTTPAPAVQEGAKRMNLQEISESAIAAFPDMTESEGGLLPLTRFTPDEQASLRKAGIVETATTSTGETYEGVNSEYLWQRRKQLQQERAAKKKQAAAPTVEAAPVEPAQPVTEAPAITPAPVAETPAVSTAPEVAPVETITMTEASELGYTQRDPKNIRTFKADKITADSLTKHLENNGFQDGDIIETPQGTAELYVADTGFAYSWKPKKGRGRDGLITDPAGGVKINPVIMRDPNAPSLTVKVEKTSPPKGYTKQGDLYVYQPTPAVSETITKPNFGEKGGVLIPSREDLIQAGQNIYEAGMEFTTWAKQMIQRFGDAVRQFLADVWEAVSGFPAKLEEMAGYLPGKGERGAVTFGRGDELPKKPAEPAPEKPAEEKPAEPEKPKERGTIARMAITAYKTTPKGILAKTTQIIKDSVFDGDSEVSESATKRAWNLISSLVATNDKSVANAEAINQLTREAMTEVKAPEGATTEEAKTFEVVKQTVGMPKLRNELFKYAIKLTGQGDKRMLDFLLNNELNLAGNSIKTKEDIGRFLGALRGISSYIITATEAEQAGFFNIAAQQFFDTKNPTDEQVQQIKDIFNKVKEVKIDQEKELMTELEEVGKAAGVDLPAAVDKQLENTPGLDPMVVAITNMLKMGGTFIYRPTKNKIGEAVKNTISRGITNYRKKIVSKAANGLETGFWKTLSSTEQKPGPLGELDSAQNRALGNIVKQALVDMKLQGTPPNTKMSIYEQVASILGEQPLSQDKIKMADEKIRGGIESKRQAELENATEDQVDAINLKYDEMTFAWDNAMSRSLDMPVSDTMLRRMILNELKEADTSIQDIAKLMEEEPVIGASRQDRLVNSIIEKVTGITFEGQLTRDYTNLKSYLSNLLENMVLARQQKNKAAKDVAKTKRDASGDPEKQAQAQIDKLAKIQADPTIFGEKKIDPVRNAVRDALALQLNIGFTPEQTAKIKNNWKGAFVADPNKKGIPTSFMLELQRLGVSEAAANTLADIVWRQIEVNAMSRQMDATTKAVEAGPIGGIVQAILDTPLANQQDPEWRKNVILDYLKNAGVKPSQAENIAKLFDVSLRKRFAKAQEEAAIKAAKSIKGGLTPNSKRAFEKFLKAIRAQVLDPGKDVAKAFAEEMGWKGFTSEQIVKLNELDAIVNDEERTEAERAVATEQIQQIIDKVSMPPQIKEMIASFYIGNALMRFPTFSVQAFDPLAMATFNTAIESFRNVTNPLQFIQTWANYGRAVSNLFRETAYSFKNDVLRSGRMIDYLDNEDRKIKRLWNEAENKWKRGDIRGAIKDGLFGYTAFTFRTLKALDDGAYSLLTSTTLPQYVEAALKNAKIPREKRRGVMRQVLHAREMDIEQMVSNGIPKNDAVIYANERMQAAITKELSGLNIDAQEVINSAINDALARIGKTRFAEDILTGKVEEVKDLGTISAPFLRWYESVSKTVSSKGSESQKIFYRILLGFPLIPARIFNIAAGYTPLTIYRHALKGRYQLTYGTALQRRQRMAEQLAGTMVLLPLLALRSNSLDEEDEKEKGFGVYITGQGPSKMKDKTLHAKWNDRHDPFSLEFRMGGKPKFAIDAKAAGPLSVMIYLFGAMDDWETNRKLDGLKTTKDDWKQAEDNASLLTSLYDLAGYAVLTTARRGPTTGVMQGLVDFRRFPDDPLAAIGADVAFSAMPAVPILGTGIAKNISDFLSQPIDNTTKEGAILANIPIVGPIAGKPALNSYGQRIGELRVSEKLKKSFGVPFTLVVSDSDEDNKLTSLTLKNGDGPTPLRREDVENAFQEAITDEEWYLAAKTFGDRNKSYVLKNYSRYEKLNPEGFSKAMSKLSRGSKIAAIAAVKKQRQKNP